jgi:hypothetical protein
MKPTLAILGGLLVIGGCMPTNTVSVDQITFDVPMTWQKESPPEGSQSRRAQWNLGGDLKVIVWQFPGMQNKAAENIERWKSQFALEDSDAPSEDVMTDHFFASGNDIYTVDIRGRYVAETFPGSGVRENKPKHRMLGGYIETPDGDYVVKLVGPAGAVGFHASAFDQMLRSMTYKPMWN